MENSVSKHLQQED